jgi:DNA repair photolyase
METACHQRRRPSEAAHLTVRGRAAQFNPTNRFEKQDVELADEFLAHEAELQKLCDEPTVLADGRRIITQVYHDRTQRVINRLDSPDLCFHWTINPYRGCEHGCIYCYARQYHELLGFSSGLDFETKIMAKPEAPALLRKELADPKWEADPIVMSGATDCYQPIESKLRITRRCLEVLAEARQPVRVITKNRLILRDLDLLTALAAHNAVRVAISVTTLDNKLAAKLEPRASSPSDRLWTIRRLASAGIGVMVMASPIIPGLTDHELPAILEAAADAGATVAAYEQIRLPYAVKDLFDDWLGRHFPDRRAKVLSRIRQCSGGKLYDPTFGNRLHGTGKIAEQLVHTFEVFARRHGLATCEESECMHALSSAAFRRPAVDNQLPLFA